MNRENFENRKNEYKKDTEKLIEKLLEKMKTMAEKLRENGFPVGDDLRINPSEYKGYYDAKKIENDQEQIEETIKKIFIKESNGEKNIPPTETERKMERLKNAGTQLEILVTLALNEFFEKTEGKFITMRTSEYDDIKHGIDTIIFDKETGEIVCAIDEGVLEFSDTRYKEKMDKIIKINERGGAKLEYGISMEKEEIKKMSRENIPVILLSVDLKSEKDGLEKILFLKNGKERAEALTTFFGYFLKTIKSQAEKIEKDEKIHYSIKRNTNNFMNKMNTQEKEIKE